MKTSDLTESASGHKVSTPSLRSAKLNSIISHVSDVIQDERSHDGKLDTDSEAGRALYLALVAMTEAEKRIDRQQKRIKYLEGLSITDELTKLLNRRGFLAQLKAALALAKRQKTGGSLVLLDLDKFKTVNDQCGHAAGDKLLTKVADCLKEKVRETDVIGRLGGDEFAILMAGLPSKLVSKRITDIESAIKSIDLTWNKKSLRVSASIGRCDFLGHETETTVLDKADKNMYSNKTDHRSN